MISASYADTVSDLKQKNPPDRHRAPCYTALYLPDFLLPSSYTPNFHVRICLVKRYLIPTDPPNGFPSCSVAAALNYTSLRLLCSWPGGYPTASLQWTGDLKLAEQDQTDTGQQTNPLTNTAIVLPSEGLPSNNEFTCMGSHLALEQSTSCSISACEQNKKRNRSFCTLTVLQTSHNLTLTSHSPSDVPPAEPLCIAYVTENQQNLVLSCSWDGGLPKALVWWEGPGGQGKSGEENSNILRLPYGTVRSGKPYTCRAKHPLLVEAKSCRLTLG